MLVGSQVKFCSPPKHFMALHITTAFSQTADEDVDLFSNVKNKHNMAEYSSSESLEAT